MERILLENSEMFHNAITDNKFITTNYQANDELEGGQKIETYRKFPNEENAVKFFKSHIERLEKIQAVGKAPLAEYACSSEIILKKNLDYRDVVDLRAINIATKIILPPPQDTKRSVKRLSKAKYYATIDLTDAFWQLKNKSRIFYIWGPNGIYRSNRVL